MIFKRFYDEKLAQASYMLACESSGEALIIDPNREIAQYLEAAKREGVRIAHVTETHIHADFVSGSRELTAATGAMLYLSDEGGADWKYAYAESDGATLLKNGSVIAFGTVQVRVLHTPGHTPEHVCFLVTDRSSAASAPVGFVSGDFLFAGDVGRPDLLERAAGEAGTMVSAAASLFASLQKLRELPDYLQVWPGHGAGSACGKALGSMPQSTLGYERIANWALRVGDEQTFIREVLSGQPTPPRYFAEMKRINRDGPRILGSVQAPVQLDMQQVESFVRDGGLLVDARIGGAYGKLHIANSISIPYNRAFTKWAGSIIPYDRPFAFIVDAPLPTAAASITRDLAMIGLDSVAGFAAPEVVAQWKDAGKQVGSVPEMSAAEVAPLIASGAVHVLDVRDAAEVEAGTIPGAQNIPLASLSQRSSEVPIDKPVVLYCEGGSRSRIGAGILDAAGVAKVINLAGGFTDWRRSGHPTHTPRAGVEIAS